MFEDDGIGFRKILSDRGNYFSNLFRRGTDELFAIDTNNLLMARDDAGFDNGMECLILDRIGHVDLLLGQ